MTVLFQLKAFFGKNVKVMVLFIALLSFGGLMNACGGPKTGCPVNERAKVKTNRKGELSRKSGKTNLFPKNVRKKMRTK